MNVQVPITKHGQIHLLDMPHACAVVREIFDEDCYDFARIPDASIVVDIGAFYGVFSIRCAVEKGCQVFAYEPSEANYEVLVANCRLNHSAHAIETRPIAIGLCGQRAFLSRPDHPAGSMLVDEAIKHRIVGSTSIVTCRNLNDEVQRIRMETSGEIVVKMDCEGAEHEIFADASWLKYVSVLVMEWHNHDGAFFRSKVESYGFDVHVEGGGPIPRPAWDSSIGGGLLRAYRRTPCV